MTTLVRLRPSASGVSGVRRVCDQWAWNNGSDFGREMQVGTNGEWDWSARRIDKGVMDVLANSAQDQAGSSRTKYTAVPVASTTGIGAPHFCAFSSKSILVMCLTPSTNLQRPMDYPLIIVTMPMTTETILCSIWLISQRANMP